MQPQEGTPAPVPEPTPAPQPTPQPSTPASPSSKTNTMAIFGLVLAFFIPILGLILSIVAKSQIKKTGEGGKGLATGGIVVSIVFMVLQIIAVAFYILVIAVAVSSTPSSNSNSSTNSNSNTSTTDTSSYSADEKKAVTSAEAFLRALSKNDKAGAYLVLSPEFKSELTKSEFDSKIENSNLKITNWSVNSVKTNGSGDRVTVKGTLDLSTGTKNGEFELVLFKGADASIGIIQFDLSSN